MPLPIHFEIHAANPQRAIEFYTKLGGTVALPKMPMPTVGWLAYVEDTEGNVLGMITTDANAK